MTYKFISSKFDCAAGDAAADWDSATKGGLSSQQCARWCTDTGPNCVGYSEKALDGTGVPLCKIYLKDGALPATMAGSDIDHMAGTAASETVVEGDTLAWTTTADKSIGCSKAEYLGKQGTTDTARVKVLLCPPPPYASVLAARSAEALRDSQT